ncbi:hypothetical protein WJX84_008554 [Apatococcus fuscideae]|uniref:Uncharacterized protein n=1 Tax=Apatococcus fuscideae TaxID=2026836 RepID=A0AAW1SH11_9CHLO
MARYCLDEPLWAYKASELAGGILQHQGNWWTTVRALVQGLQQPSCSTPTALARPLAGFCPRHLFQRWHRRHADISMLVPHSSVVALPMVDGAGLDAKAFIFAFDKPGQPAVLRGLQESWSGQKMTLEILAQRHPECTFEVSKPGAHEDVRLFAQVWREAADLLQQYQVPSLFPEDLMACLGEQARPSYRWLLAGTSPESGC